MNVTELIVTPASAPVLANAMVQVHALVCDLTKEERDRVLWAVYVLCGDEEDELVKPPCP
jgi:hypothetical protein